MTTSTARVSRKTKYGPAAVLACLDGKKLEDIESGVYLTKERGTRHLFVSDPKYVEKMRKAASEKGMPIGEHKDKDGKTAIFTSYRDRRTYERLNDAETVTQIIYTEIWPLIQLDPSHREVVKLADKHVQTGRITYRQLEELREQIKDSNDAAQWD